MSTAAVQGAWALVPAAGSGSRLGGNLPKQYLSLAGRPVLMHTLERLCTHARIRGVLVGVAPDDRHWPKLACPWPRLLGTFLGGPQRSHTVLNGLRALSSHAQSQDWVLVHDAARPCVRAADIDRLLQQAGPDGGLLALPVTDTIKRANIADEVSETVSRQGLWRALTPQLFRIEQLTHALEQALGAGLSVTDEAMAIEHSGGRPRLVPGHADNIKITVAADLALAEWYLRQQATE